MGRRLTIVIVTALAAVGFGVPSRPVAARQDDPTPASASREAEHTLNLPPAKPAAAKAAPKSKAGGPPPATPNPSPAPDPAGEPPAELPPEVAAAATPPSNLGPEPTPYSEADAPSAKPEPAPEGGRSPIPLPSRLKGLFGAKPKADKAAAAEPKADPAVNPVAAPAAESKEKDEAGAPPGALPAPPSMPAPPGSDAPPPATLPAPAEPADMPPVKTDDDAVERVQAPGAAPGPNPAPGEGKMLPPAAERPGQPAGKGSAKEPETPFVVAPENLPVGKQSIGLTVEVIAPQFLNVNQTSSLKVVVRNPGTTDAKGVVVRDALPPNLSYVGSQPEAARADSVLTWHLGDVPAGSERVIRLDVKPTAVGAFEHAATVTMAAGARSRTVVREPKLKVEVTANSNKILKGQPVSFKITVSNPGDGPARNVKVQAKLSPGLREESGEPNSQNLFEQTLDYIGPGEAYTLAPLGADTVLGGEQTCAVATSSPDVIDSPEARATQSITVVEPKLTLNVSGPKDRYTDTLANYEVRLENPGTAAAKNVKVVVTIPINALLLAPLPPGARFDKETHKLTWARTQLDANEKAVLAFQVRMAGVGVYQIAAEARALSVPLAKDVFQTDVTGLADVTLDVSEKRRVVDVDGETTFVIRVTNSGTKEATQLAISAVLSDNLEPGPTIGTETEARWNPAEHRVVFPLIERLGHGKSMDLGIKVKAVKPGIATCRAFLQHKDLDVNEKLDDIAAFKVTPVRR